MLNDHSVISHWETCARTGQTSAWITEHSFLEITVFLFLLVTVTKIHDRSHLKKAMFYFRSGSQESMVARACRVATHMLAGEEANPRLEGWMGVSAREAPGPKVFKNYKPSGEQVSLAGVHFIITWEVSEWENRQEQTVKLLCCAAALVLGSVWRWWHTCHQTVFTAGQAQSDCQSAMEKIQSIGWRGENGPLGHLFQPQKQERVRANLIYFSAYRRQSADPRDAWLRGQTWSSQCFVLKDTQ